MNGHPFRVWAPAADQVELCLAGERLPMEPARGGWWQRAVSEADHGTRYAFALDGGPARPDPRSPHQPDGVDGWSAVVDHGRFQWTDGAWRGLPLKGAVLYELHVGTFTPDGTFDAAIERLDHLVALGIDAIELLPVAEFPGRRGWGYDGVDLYAPHHAYGGPAGLKRLVDACHHAGIGVVMDVVYNHLGPAGNYLPEFGPYFTDRYRTGWGDAVNFDGPGSDEVRRFVADNALMWLTDYHCDGLRLDAVHAIFDESAVHILEQIATEAGAAAAHAGRPLFVIAESDLNQPQLVRLVAAGGFGLDAAWADDWHHALHAVLTGERAGYYQDFGTWSALAKALKQAWVMDGTWSSFRQRHHGRPPTGLGGAQFVVSAQNHDQVGNRAQGERLSGLVSWGRLRVAAALLLTGPFTPMLFQGEEWGAASPFQYFTDHPDPKLGQAVSKGRRQEFAAFGWSPEDVPDPQDPATYSRSVLGWTEPTVGEHQRLLDWYRDLIALRRAVPDLRDPRLTRTTVDYDEAAGWLQVRRGGHLIAANLGPATTEVPVGCPGEVLLASDPGAALTGPGLRLEPESAAIIRLT